MGTNLHNTGQSMYERNPSSALSLHFTNNDHILCVSVANQRHIVASSHDPILGSQPTLKPEGLCKEQTKKMHRNRQKET